ncbi:hypothetical protein Bca4012_092582 [Brassica carinata]|uniref:Uncharacterized protein n=1 Tax=Brassica carinata TaxID=52824 RepID=A0A8X7PS04_BRACI|nr:hypothetical protein Bca52824_074927 [Brassica carinata]
MKKVVLTCQNVRNDDVLALDGSFSSCIQGPMVQITAGVWRFNEYHIVLSHYIVVRANKQIDSRKGYLRGVFNLSTQTPLLVTPQIEVHVEVFSIGSSTEVKTVGEMGGEMNIATIGCSGPGGDVICEKGESLRRGINGSPAKLEGEMIAGGVPQIAQRIYDSNNDGNTGGVGGTR